jgi:hypothetical protein
VVDSSGYLVHDGYRPVNPGLDTSVLQLAATYNIQGGTSKTRQAGTSSKRYKGPGSGCRCSGEHLPASAPPVRAPPRRIRRRRTVPYIASLRLAASGKSGAVKEFSEFGLASQGLERRVSQIGSEGGRHIREYQRPEMGDGFVVAFRLDQRTCEVSSGFKRGEMMGSVASLMRTQGLFEKGHAPLNLARAHP